MIENKQLYSLAESVGLSRMAFYRRAQLEGMTPPLSTEEFQKVALIVAGSPRIDDGQRKAILKLVNSETTPTEKDFLPYFRTKESNHKIETTQVQGAIGIETGAAETVVPARVLPETRIEEKGFVRETKPVGSAQVVSLKPETTETENLTYAQTAGNTIRKMDGFAGVLMFLSAAGVSYTLYTVGSAFTANFYFQLFLGIFAIVAAWKWEGALKAQINTFMHQLIYKLWGGAGGLILSSLVLITLLAPNIYQGVVAAKKLSSVVAPIHIENDGTGINDRLIKEKESIAADYERTRAALKQEQETAALADPTVAKFADYERSEIQNAKAIRNTAEVRRKEAANYRSKGEKANANWCIHLANQEEKKAKGADAKAEQWRVKKEQASASVYASYAAAFTKLEQDEKREREDVAARYQGLLVNHTKSEGQKRENSERQNEGIMMIGLIFLPIADFVVLLLIFLKVNYFKRTNQVDPSLKAYKVGEKSKLEQFLSGVVGPAWDTIFGKVLQFGYHYQAMAQASMDRAEFVKKLKAREAELRIQRYEQKITDRITKLGG